jgi:hypothetical protein
VITNEAPGRGLRQLFEPFERALALSIIDILVAVDEQDERLG